MAFSPLLPTPFTDFTWILAPGFNLLPPDSLCAKVQLKYLDCIEAYGLGKGSEKCAELFYDLCECRRPLFQFKRVEEIRKERMRKFRAGKLVTPFSEHPPMDSYLYM